MPDTRTPESRHKLNKEIGARCRTARKAAGYTQEVLAEKLNVSTQYLSDMERGIVGLSLLIMVDLSVLLSVSTDYLMKGIPDDEPQQIKIGSKNIPLTKKEFDYLEKNIDVFLQAFHVNE